MATILSNTQVLSAIGLPADTVDKLLVAQGNTYEAVSNDFLTALVNKICYQKIEHMDFDNPFKKFDSYPVNFGTTIENVFVDTPLGYQYGTDGTDPFKTHDPVVKTLYVSINYKMQYCVSIKRDFIRQCCLNNYGFMDLIKYIIQSINTRRSVDEYMATIIAMNNSDIYAKGFEEIDVSSKTTNAEKMKEVTTTIGKVLSDMALPSIDNNKQGVLTSTKANHMLCVIKQELMQDINFDYLAGVYNLEKVELKSKFIPVRSFKCVINTANGDTLTPSEKGDDIDFIIVDDRGFDNHIAVEDNASIYNPKQRQTNYYADLWKIISYRTDHQARAFKVKRS